MGCCQTKPQYSRNFILDSRRRQLKYGLTIQNIEKFWNSEDFQTFRAQFYSQNPNGQLGMLSERDSKHDQPVPDGYIDTWNSWKNKQDGISNLPNLSYPSQEENPYYPDIFAEMVDQVIRPTVCFSDTKIPHCPVYHNRQHVNTIKNLYRDQAALHSQEYKSLQEYVIHLLDENEFHQLVKKINTTYSNVIPDNLPRKIII